MSLQLCGRPQDILVACKLGCSTYAHAAEANMYKADGTTMRSASIPITQDPQCVRAFRDEIALCVINEAKRLHPNAIEFHFNTLIQNVDLDRQTVHVSTGSNVTEVRSN